MTVFLKRRTNSSDQTPTVNYKLSHQTKLDSTKNEDDETLHYESPTDPDNQKIVTSKHEELPGYSTRIYISQNSQLSVSQPYEPHDPPAPQYMNK